MVSTTDQVTTGLGETALPYTSCPDAVNGGVEDPLYTVDEPVITNLFKPAFPITEICKAETTLPEETVIVTIPSF